jgi:broad specificity phosphatase PhoE
METRILLARHGQTEWNRDESGPSEQVRFRGRMDLALSEHGQREAEALARRIAAEYQPALIYSSPLRRALQTARAIAQATSRPIRVAQGLADIDYGAWQGLTAAEAKTRDLEAYRRWMAAVDSAGPPGGETLTAVQQRAWDEIIRITAAQPGESVVAVSHDIVCKLIIAHVLGRPVAQFRSVSQHTATLNLLIHDAAGWHAGFIDDVQHLASVAP